MSLLCNTLSRLVIREGYGTPLQYSCLENPMDGGAWWAAVHGVAKSWTRLSNFPFTFHFHALEKEIQCSCLENPSDVGAWWAVVYGVTQSQTWLKWLSSSRLAIDFLPRSKHLFISWLQSPSAVILEPKKIKSVTVSIVSPFICHEVMGLEAMISVFWMLSFKPAFSLSSRDSLVPL